ncbi:MAG TPA: hypothetical protein VK054_01450, partial [Beutenbergiaceae bacterium]|nr:hypothetical protein [Beutenbergiaceae bacterium]
MPSFHHTHAGLATHMPEVGEADHATVVRPHPASAPALDAHGGVGSEGAGAQGGATGEPDLLSRGTGESDSHGVDNGESDPLGRKRGRKTALLVGAGIGAAVLVGVGVFAALGSNAFSETDDVASEPISINQTDRPLPTGLTTTRVASFDPEAQNITLEVTYAGQKSPLSGSFLEVVAPFEGEEACPHVQWEEDAGQPHKASTTGLKAECGWRFDDVVVDVDGQTTFTGTIDATVADRQELEEWLDVTARATEGALTNPEVTSTAYPAQRLQDIAVEVPERMVSQTPVEITLLPVWPSGEDELNPLMRSPVSGAPSTMLVDIAGSFDNVRFSDGCSGSVAVSSDGLSAMALSVST